jgi:hypothetical protein
VPEADDEPIYQAFTACLRIVADDLPHDEITRTLGVQPMMRRKRGDRRRPGSAPAKDAAWHFQPPVPEECDLSEHLRALWQVIAPHIAYLRDLKARARIDIFCGYRSNHGGAGFEVAPDALKPFVALDIPFGISVVIDGYVVDRLKLQ